MNMKSKSINYLSLFTVEHTFNIHQTAKRRLLMKSSSLQTDQPGRSGGGGGGGRIGGGRIGGGRSGGGGGGASGGCHGGSTSQRQGGTEHNYKAFITTVILWFTLVIFWLPYMVFHFLSMLVDVETASDALLNAKFYLIGL